MGRSVTSSPSVGRPAGGVGVATIALVTGDEGLRHRVAGLAHTRVDQYADISELPTRQYYAVYVIDASGTPFDTLPWPQVEMAGEPPSRFLFAASDVDDLADWGELPPRSVVVDRDEGLLPRLKALLEPALGNDHGGKRFAHFAAIPSRRAVFFALADGRTYVISLKELGIEDTSPVSALSLTADGYAVLIRQLSGTESVVPWDMVLYLAEPEYRRHLQEGSPPDPLAPNHVNSGAEGADEQKGVVIGRRIRLERARRRWTLADMSARTRIKVPNLSRLERGRHTPSLETLEKVADALGMPVAALVTE